MDTTMFHPSFVKSVVVPAAIMIEAKNKRITAIQNASKQGAN